MQILTRNFVWKSMVLTLQGGSFFSHIIFSGHTLSMIRSLCVRSAPDSKILSLYCISARALPLSLDSKEMQQHSERTRTCPIKYIRTRNSVTEIQSNLRSYIRLLIPRVSLSFCLCLSVYVCFICVIIHVYVYMYIHIHTYIYISLYS